MTDQPDTPQTPPPKAFSPVAAEPTQRPQELTPAELADRDREACMNRAKCLQKSSAIRNAP